MATKSEVDRLTDVYAEYQDGGAWSGRWSVANPGNRAMVAQRRRILQGMLEQRGLLPLRGRKILEVGCGRGGELAALTEWGAEPADLCGIDLRADGLVEARKQYPQIRFEQANAESLQFADNSFDLVMAITVFTSILDQTMAANVASEISRVLKPGGAVIWYDFRYDNPQNRNVRGIGQREVEALFSGHQAFLRTTTLLPPLGRRLGPATGLLYPLLSAFPPLRSHVIGLLVKPNHH